MTNFALGFVRFVDESHESCENRRSGRSLAVLSSCPREPRGLRDLRDYLRPRQSPGLRKCNVRVVKVLGKCEVKSKVVSACMYVNLCACS